MKKRRWKYINVDLDSDTAAFYRKLAKKSGYDISTVLGIILAYIVLKEMTSTVTDDAAD